MYHIEVQFSDIVLNFEVSVEEKIFQDNQRFLTFWIITG